MNAAEKIEKAFDRYPLSWHIEISAHDVQEVINDLRSAVAAMDDVMACDKGQSEEEWIAWCNEHLPLVKKYGLQKFTVEFV